MRKIEEKEGDREREQEADIEREKGERKREGGKVCMYVCACVCARVCVRERERKKKKKRHPSIWSRKPIAKVLFHGLKAAEKQVCQARHRIPAPFLCSSTCLPGPITKTPPRITPSPSMLPV